MIILRVINNNYVNIIFSIRERKPEREEGVRREREKEIRMERENLLVKHCSL